MISARAIQSGLGRMLAGPDPAASGVSGGASRTPLPPVVRSSCDSEIVFDIAAPSCDF
jgi:hypothetical protein